LSELFTIKAMKKTVACRFCRKLVSSNGYNVKVKSIN